jgi:hypothetical protein
MTLSARLFGGVGLTFFYAVKIKKFPTPPASSNFTIQTLGKGYLALVWATNTTLFPVITPMVNPSSWLVPSHGYPFNSKILKDFCIFFKQTK